MSSLITLDLDGLVDSLSEMQATVKHLGAKSKDLETKIADNTQFLNTIKKAQSGQADTFGKDADFLKAQISYNEKKIDSIQLSVGENSTTIERLGQREKEQEESLKKLARRMFDSEQNIATNTHRFMEQIPHMLLKEEFQSEKDIILVQIDRAEKETHAVREQLEASENSVQELFDRVESLENQQTNLDERIESQVQQVQLMIDQAVAKIPQGQLSGVVATPPPIVQLGEAVEQPPKSSAEKVTTDQKAAESSKVVIIPKRQLTTREINDAELEAAKKYIKKALKDHQRLTLVELFDLTVEWAEKQRRDTVESERAAQHLPSVLDPLFEEHIKSVGSHLVWLDQIQPKFVMPNGQFTVGSDYQKVFAHVEVQTFQQHQLLKQQNQDSLALLKLRDEIEELRQDLKVERRRINGLEEGAEVDLGQMAVEGAGLTELFKTMQEMKKEILKKTVTRDKIQNVERDFQELKKQVLTKPDREADSQLRQQVLDAIAKVQKFDGSLQSLQMQIMKNETLSFDVERSCQFLERKIQQIDERQQNVLKFLNQRMSSVDVGSRQHTSEIREPPVSPGTSSFEQVEVPSAAEKVHREPSASLDLEQIKLSFSEMFVTLEDQEQTRLDLKNGLKTIDQLKTQLTQMTGKVQDHGKSIRSLDGLTKQLTQQTGNLQHQMTRIETAQQNKTDLDLFEEEISQIKSLMGTEKAQKALKKAMPARQPQSFGQGLSVSQKQGLTEMKDMVEKHDTAIKDLENSIAALDLAEIRSKLQQFGSEIPELAPKSAIEKLEFDSKEEILRVKQLMRDNQDDLDKQTAKIQERIDKRLADSEAKDEALEQISIEVRQLSDQLQAIKRNVGGKRALPLMKADELSRGQDSDETAGGKLKDEIFRIQKDFKKKIDDINADLKLLMPLVNPSSAGTDAPKSDLEQRLTNKIVQMTSKNAEKMFTLKSEIDDLKLRFEEKIRRQSLVAQKKRNQHADDSGERSEVKKARGEKRPMFLANQFTRELALNGRLPQLESYGDYIARYGKGFSQMIAMADTHVTASPRAAHRESHEILSDTEHHRQQASTLSAKQIKQFASHPEFQLDAPAETTRVHPNLKGHVFKLKKSEQRQSVNRTSLQPLPNTGTDPQPPQTKKKDLLPQDEEQPPTYLPVITSNRSVSDAKNIMSELQRTI